MNQSNLFVSVIVPTFKDWERLNECLICLKRQSYPVHLFEIIIVDNECLEEYPFSLKLPANAIIIGAKERGSYSARNEAILLAKGDVLAFTDSDCLPDERWLEKGVAHLNSSIDGIGGQVMLFYKDAKRLTPAERYESRNAFRQRYYIDELKFSVTANLIVKKTAFDTTGHFNSNLQSGGDREWGNRFFSKGYKLIYANDVIVKHPARTSIQSLVTKTVRVTEGMLDLNIFQKNRLNLLSLLPPLRRTWRYILEGERKESIFHKIQYITVWYLLHYVKAYCLIKSGVTHKKIWRKKISEV